MVATAATRTPAPTVTGGIGMTVTGAGIAADLLRTDQGMGGSSPLTFDIHPGGPHFAARRFHFVANPVQGGAWGATLTAFIH